jgi:hypothetical protein
MKNRAIPIPSVSSMQQQRPQLCAQQQQRRGRTPTVLQPRAFARGMDDLGGCADEDACSVSTRILHAQPLDAAASKAAPLLIVGNALTAAFRMCLSMCPVIMPAVVA